MDTHAKADGGAHVLVGTLEVEDVRALFERCATSRFTGLLEMDEGARRVTVGFVAGEPLEGIDALKLGAMWRRGSWRLSQRALDLSGGLADGVTVEGALADASPMDLLGLCEDGRLSAEIAFSSGPGDDAASAVVRFGKGRMEGAELNGKPDMAALMTVGRWKDGRFSLTVRPQFAAVVEAPAAAAAAPSVGSSEEDTKEIPAAAPATPVVLAAPPVAPPITPPVVPVAAPIAPAAEESASGWETDDGATGDWDAAPLPALPVAAAPARPPGAAVTLPRPSLLGAKGLAKDAKPGAPAVAAPKTPLAGAGGSLLKSPPSPSLPSPIGKPLAAGGVAAAKPLAGGVGAAGAVGAAGSSLFSRGAAAARAPGTPAGSAAPGSSLLGRAAGAGPAASSTLSSRPLSPTPSLLGRAATTLPSKPGVIAPRLGVAAPAASAPPPPPPPASPKPASASSATPAVAASEWALPPDDEPVAAVPEPAAAKPAVEDSAPALVAPAPLFGLGDVAAPDEITKTGVSAPPVGIGSEPPTVDEGIVAALAAAVEKPAPTETATAAAVDHETPATPLLPHPSANEPEDDENSGQWWESTSPAFAAVPVQPLPSPAVAEAAPQPVPPYDDSDDELPSSRPFQTMRHSAVPPPEPPPDFGMSSGSFESSSSPASHADELDEAPVELSVVVSPRPSALPPLPPLFDDSPPFVPPRPPSAAGVTQQLGHIPLVESRYDGSPPEFAAPPHMVEAPRVAERRPRAPNSGLMWGGGVVALLVAIGLVVLYVGPWNHSGDTVTPVTPPAVAPNTVPSTGVVKAPPTVAAPPVAPTTTPRMDEEVRLVAAARKASIEGRRSEALRLFRAAIKLNPKDPAFPIYVPMARGKTGQGKLLLDGKGPVVINGHTYVAPGMLIIEAGPYAVGAPGQTEEVIVEKGGSTHITAKPTTGAGPVAPVPTADAVKHDTAKPGKRGKTRRKHRP